MHVDLNPLRHPIRIFNDKNRSICKAIGKARNLPLGSALVTLNDVDNKHYLEIYTLVSTRFYIRLL